MAETNYNHEGVVEFLNGLGEDSPSPAHELNGVVSERDILLWLQYCLSDPSPAQKESFAYLRHELKTPMASMHHLTTILLSMKNDGLAKSIPESKMEILDQLIDSVDDVLLIMAEGLSEGPR